MTRTSVRSRGIGLALLAGAALALLTDLSHGSKACAQQSVIFVRLDGFPSEASARYSFYYGVEGQGSTTFEVSRTGDDCSRTGVTVDYAGSDGTAVAGSDYSLPPGEAGPLYDPVHDGPLGFPTHDDVEIAIADDVDAEDAVEFFTVALSNPSKGSLTRPRTAPVFIVDDDGASRASLAQTSLAVPEGAGEVPVPVFRAGDSSAATSLDYAIESGSAILGEDAHGDAQGIVSFGAGERVATIPLRVVDDDDREEDETLTVTVVGPEATGITSATVTIADNEESVEPRSRFHHPRDGRRYGRDDYRVREMHIFTRDEGSGVVRAQVALRRTTSSGRCAWWDGDTFRRGACGAKRWLRTRTYEPGDFYYFRIRRLKPSVGTNVRSYKVFARSIDDAGNVESAFTAGRNANRFEITGG